MRYFITDLKILFLFVLFPLELFSIENKFEYITPENGLSQGNIECIFQDRMGFMWFGTFNGLNRFDGYSIQIYNHDIDDPNSLSHEHIVKMCEDEDGKIWLGTYGGGVSVYYPELNIFQRIQKVIIKADTSIQLTVINSRITSPKEEGEFFGRNQHLVL